ncbi:hypothetical protein RUM43_008647 [Polyplax serrata]|uniref:Uncharacterized protein n=1 Tax=Polyplax serrata TaxID=468196 RepID=A0AAN8RTX1_POLSC
MHPLTLKEKSLLALVPEEAAMISNVLPNVPLLRETREYDFFFLGKCGENRFSLSCRDVCQRGWGADRKEEEKNNGSARKGISQWRILQDNYKNTW